jgi:hypothetical protein
LRQPFGGILGRVIRKPRLLKLLGVTTPSASSAPAVPVQNYISRGEAAALYDGTPRDIFQGDIYRSIEIMIPRPTGGYRDYEPLPVMVVAHDCEWTKALKAGDEYKFGIAPLRRLSAFRDEKKPGLEGMIGKNQVRYLFPLPQEDPLDDTYVVDLRLIQPITVAELLSHDLWTSIGDGVKKPLQGKLIVFYANAELVQDGEA